MSHEKQKETALGNSKKVLYLTQNEEYSFLILISKYLSILQFEKTVFSVL